MSFISMENCTIEYNIAAVFVAFVLLLIYNYRKVIYTKTGRIFATMLFWVLLISTGNIMTLLTNASWFADSVSLRYAVHIPCLLSYLGLSYSFFEYVLTLIKTDSRRIPTNIIGNITTLVFALLIVSTPFTHWFCNLEIKGEYKAGPLYPVLYIYCMVLMIVQIVLVCRFRQKFTGQERFSIIMGIVAAGIAAVLQMTFPTKLVIPFADSLILIVVYAALEDPVGYMHKGEMCYNEKAFLAKLNEQLGRKGSKSIVLFGTTDFLYLKKALSVELLEKLEQRIVDSLGEQIGKKNFFCLDTFVFATITDREPIIVAEDLVNKYPGHFTIGSKQVSMSLKAGIVRCDDFEGVDRLKDTVNFFKYELEHATDDDTIIRITPDTLKPFDRENKITEAVTRALRDKSFVVYYQPILDSATDRFSCAEALLRLYDSEMGFVPPDEFIPIAEKNGLITSIGEFVLEEVCRFYREENLFSKGVDHISVNLSRIQCMQENLVDRIRDHLDEYGIGPNHIVLEITETAEYDDENTVMNNLYQLENDGIRFSLDDFGTGYANLEHLTHLPIKYVKLDKSLVWNAMKNSDSLTILRNISKMIKELKFESIAEGVETKEMFDLLEMFGVDLYQGYLFAKPMPGKEYVHFLDNRRLVKSMK